MAVTNAQVQALYVAYFNRPADFFGLTYQVSQANTLGLQYVADQFSKSPEYIATYAGKSVGEVVDTIYMNLFGRHAEPAGLKFWGDLLSNPKSGITIGNAALTIFNGAINDDRIACDNKVVAAQAFYDSLDTNAEIVGYSGDAANQVLKAWMATITTDATLAANTTAAALAAVSADAIIAHDGSIQITTVLTTGIDTFAGTGAADTIIATLNTGGTDGTLTALDTIDGGNGIDTLQINDLKAAGSTMPAGLIVKNVENINVRGAGVVNVDSSSFTGATALNVVQSTDATVKAGSGTAITVTGATGDIVADGGSSQTVSSDGGSIDLGGTTATAGAISATHSDQAADDINIDGGSTVTVNSTGITTGSIAIGASTAATGAVVVNATGAAVAAGVDNPMGTIDVTGGASVTINVVATADDAEVAADTTGSTVTMGDVTVTADSSTLSVSVTQTAEATEAAYIAAIAGVKEKQTVTFGAMAIGETLIINGLTFTALKAMTAAQVAATFANLSASSVQGTMTATNGIYSGTFNTLGFTTGAVTTASGVSSVVFTGTTNANLAAVTIAGTAAGTALASSVDGSAATALQDGVLGVVAGKVDVEGNITGTDKLATVVLDGFGAGSLVKSDALTSLTLANSANDVTVTNASATTLALNVATLDATAALGATYTTLNVVTSGDDSILDLTAGGVTTLNVSGTSALDLSTMTMGALKTIKVSGAAGLTIDASVGATVTSVDTTASTGVNTMTVDTSVATYAGGAGEDDVTLANTTTTKAVTLGGGDDSLTLASTTTSLTATMSGGTGTDTLVMDAADAVTASASTTFATKIDGFEHLTIGVTGAVSAIDLANMDNISYVTTTGLGAGFGVTFDHMAAAGTLVLTDAAAAAETTTINLTDATGTADVLNVITKVSTANLTFGTVVAAGVETINVTATDTASSTINTATLDFTDAALKAVVVTGNSNLTLTANATLVALASVDGSAMTGKLVATTNGTVAETIKGGAAADTLTAIGTSDVLNGGAGADTLIVTGNLTSLTGGSGNDTFNIGDATVNVNSYATITDLTAGDKIAFAASGAKFIAAKITLADTAVFQDYANAAIAQTDTGDIGWFTFAGNTYVIENVSNDASSFVNNSDIIVKITGTAIDLSLASYSSSADTLLIV